MDWLKTLNDKTSRLWLDKISLTLLTVILNKSAQKKSSYKSYDCSQKCNVYLFVLFV